MNMILHCTICDDNPSAVKREKEIADRTFCEMNISADISVYTDSSQFMFELGDNKQMDILILDIEMPKMSGIFLMTKMLTVSLSMTEKRTES